MKAITLKLNGTNHQETLKYYKEEKGYIKQIQSMNEELKITKWYSLANWSIVK